MIKDIYILSLKELRSISIITTARNKIIES